jgi:hypothetical protein
MPLQVTDLKAGEPAQNENPSLFTGIGQNSNTVDGLSPVPGWSIFQDRTISLGLPLEVKI